MTFDSFAMVQWRLLPLQLIAAVAFLVAELPVSIDATLNVAVKAGCGGEHTAADWLVSGCDIRSTVDRTVLSDGSIKFLLANGIVERTLVVNATSGLIADNSLEMSAQGDPRLAGPGPLGSFVINGIDAIVGGPEPAVKADVRSRGKFLRYRTAAPVAGAFHWVSGVRGTDPSVAWPPRGMRVEFDVKFSCGDFHGGNGSLVATAVFELYDETSAFGRRLLLNHNCSIPLYVFNMSVTTTRVLRDRTIFVGTDAALSTTRIIHDPFDRVTFEANGYLAPSDQFTWGPGLSGWTALDPPFESYFAVEVVFDTDFDTDPPLRGMSRYGLTYARAMRVVSPQIEQNPIKVSGVCVGGHLVPPPDGIAGSEGSWCYDAEGTAGLKALIEQCSVAGVEMLVIPQNMNNTWRSMVANEFTTAANRTWLKGIVNMAHAAGIEVGTYQLLLNARSATAFNQAAPADAPKLPRRGYDCLAPDTLTTCNNKGAPCALCGATEFYDQMEASMLAWWHATGVSVVDQDGSESSTPCANESHLHHHGLNDSIWEQYRAVRRTYHEYLLAPSVKRVEGSALSARVAAGVVPPVGFIAGMPGSVIEAGESKVPGGYSEMTFSLPRWTWIDRIRESIIASPYFRDYNVPINQRMFPLPMSAPYHPSEPDPDRPGKWRAVTGYTSAATLAPFEEHVPELEWALSQAWGSGAFPQLRGHSLWDGPRSKAVVKKWISWAKRYRRVLSSQFVTLAHGIACWGRGIENAERTAIHRHLKVPGKLFENDPPPNASCTASGLDALLHRAPIHYYADVDERALALVWNPTNQTVSQTLLAPLYYAGLSTIRGIQTVTVRQEDGVNVSVRLGVNDTIPLHVTLPPRMLTWFVVSE